MGPRVVAGTGNPALAAAVTAALGCEPVPCEPRRSPDGEREPVVGPVRGGDVYVVQPTGPPVGEHLVELLLLVDACRRAGAARITAVVPYFGYARQDRRSRPGAPVGARVALDALVSAGAQRLVVVDPHTVGLEATSGVPVEMPTAVPVLAAALRPALPAGAVVVAPDLGAVKLAERYASSLGGPVAVVRKQRVSAEEVRAGELVGDVAGRAAVVVDDMISTGATVEAAVRVLAGRGALGGITVAATHALLVGDAGARLAAAGVRRLVVADTLPAPAAPGVALERCSVAGVLADAIGRLHRDEELGDPAGRP